VWTEIVTRLHLNAGNVAVLGGGTLAMILTCSFCWIRGSRPDRIGAVVFAACWIIQGILSLVHLWITGDLRPPLLLDIACDVTPGSVYLWLSIRNNSLWFAAVALTQGVQSAIDAADQTIRDPIGTFLPLVLILSLNVLNLVMMAAMIGSVVTQTKRRSQGAAQAA